MKISKEVFEEEIALCCKMHKKKAGCAWGKCENCAVLPLLFKLHKGILIEDEEEVKKMKETIFNE